MKILVLVSLLFFLGCASTTEKRPLVTDRSARINTHGIAITPPPGSNWRELIEGDDISYGKIKKDKRTHSFMASVVVMGVRTEYATPTDFLTLIKKKIENNEESDSFRNMRINCALDDQYGEYCVKYHVIFEDHSAKNREREHLMTEVFGYTMLHPYNHSVAVDVSYSERCEPGDENMEWREEGEEFLRSLNFRKDKPEQALNNQSTKATGNE